MIKEKKKYLFGAQYIPHKDSTLAAKRQSPASLVKETGVPG